MKNLNVVILAAGEGTRMASRIPKVLHPLAGQPIISYVLSTVFTVKPKNVIVVVGQDDRVRSRILEDYSKIRNLEFVRQDKPLGTAHALACTRKNLKDAEQVLVIAGDVPLISRDTLEEIIAFHNREHTQGTCLAARLANPSGYGRIWRGPTNEFLKIIEEKDAGLRELQIREVNSGIYVFDREPLLTAIAQVHPDNAKKEYYLTDVIEILRTQGHRVAAWQSPNGEELLGVNTRVDLARAESVLQRWTLDALMREGVTIPLPQSVYVEPVVRIGEDTVIYPGVILKGKTVIGKNCELGPNLYLENCTLGNNVRAVYSFAREVTMADFVSAGPFSHLRPGTHLAERVKVGNFTEIKESSIGEDSKVPHLAYIGDAEIAARCNIGAGTITCNYDGVRKNKTVVESDTFVGSNVNLVAPLKIGKNALVAAGSTITRDVPSNTLAIARSFQIHKRRNEINN
ncbi:MAG: bifunctional UDP-N-acetylglucosamine diphosphorylase/glucosamine-1-phosphate N-acetyltransferase GlmU [Elusimicrobia bacterium]|nr:bifunctional UDP-N-acetylglucosamine diphosphorylase/glucosamine-1-phosphate N-acetyltransferase GlmU [Elusimicrobiota bacterium]